MSRNGEGLIAVFGDVHGNLLALEAVLSDARAAGAERFVDLGDCVSGPLWPAETAELLMTLGAVTVRGNNDRSVVNSEPAATIRSQLTGAHLSWLASLPAIAWITDDVVACHGSPTDDTLYLLEEATHRGIRRRSPTDVAALLGPTAGQATMILCGHTHLPRLLPLADGRQVLNPGSVGLPAYADSEPFDHVMESGSPHARYALLRRSKGRWSAELRAIDYPWDEAAALARKHERDDWAFALCTGLTSRG